MSEQYLYGGAPAEVVAAVGAQGVILRTGDDRLTFRVYGEHGQITDCEIQHDELSVTIDADELVSFYRIGDDRILDHSPEVLGLKRVGG